MRVGSQRDGQGEAVLAVQYREDAALTVMEQHLASHTFFVDERYSITDIALYAYTHVADEGGFDLTPFPHTRAWLARVQGQPRHIPITRR